MVFNSKTGKEIYQLLHEGNMYLLVEEEDINCPYHVRILNYNNFRCKACVSIDGICAISGKDAHSDGSGYVLNGKEHYDVLGWRRGLNEVAQFTFTSLQDSYAHKTDRKQNVGVIGVSFHKEFDNSKMYFSEQYTKNCRALDDGLGTGYGDKKESSVHKVNFVSDNNYPVVKYAVFYKTRQELQDMGAVLPVNMSALPDPFPADSSCFVPEP